MQTKDALNISRTQASHGRDRLDHSETQLHTSFTLAFSSFAAQEEDACRILAGLCTRDHHRPQRS